MGEFCKDEVPLLCDHIFLRNSSRHTRPCSLAESYVSTGRDLTLEHILRQGSALYPISFVLRYEFVHNSMSCHLVFSSLSTYNYPSTSSQKKSTGISGKFTSPKSVFFYGRGGAQNLSCVYRFEAETNQNIEISISKASFGDKLCMSYVDPLVNRWQCDRRPSDVEKNGYAELIIAEYPWTGVKLVRDCLCSNITNGIAFTSLTSNIVELTFTVTRMNVTQDFDDFIFEGNYRFVDKIQRLSCPSRFEERKLGGTSGEISLKSPLISTATKLHVADIAAVEEMVKNTQDFTATECVNEPWLIEPEESRINFLYLRTTGFIINADNIADCMTLNRIIVYSAVNTKERSVICPEQGDKDNTRTVDFFSGGWNYTAINGTPQLIAMTQHSRSFVVEFIQKEPGFYAITWIAISKNAKNSQFSPDNNNNAAILTPINDCLYR